MLFGKTVIRPCTLLVIAGLCPVLFHTSATAADDQLQQFLAQTAEEVARYVKGKKQDSIAVQFIPPTGIPTRAGAGMLQCFTDELKGHDIQVVARSRFAFKCEFTPERLALDDDLKKRKEQKQDLIKSATDQLAQILAEMKKGKERKQVLIKLVCSVLEDFKSVPKLEKATLIEDDRLIAEVFGVNVNLNGVVKFTDRQTLLDTSISDPTWVVENGKIKPTASSPFAIAVVVDGKRRTPTKIDGLPYVSLKRSEKFAIEMHNAANLESAVTLKLDGISAFHFIDENLRSKEKRQGDIVITKGRQPLFNRFVLPSKGEVLVTGWFKNHEKAQEFTIVPIEESAAARVGDKSSLGMITASFHACWEKDQEPPLDEPSKERNYWALEKVELPDGKIEYRPERRLPRELIRPDGPNGVGFGKDVPANFEQTKRTVGQLRATVTIRYQRPEKE